MKSSDIDYRGNLGRGEKDGNKIKGKTFSNFNHFNCIFSTIYFSLGKNPFPLETVNGRECFFLSSLSSLYWACKSWSGTFSVQNTFAVMALLASLKAEGLHEFADVWICFLSFQVSQLTCNYITWKAYMFSWGKLRFWPRGGVTSYSFFLSSCRSLRRWRPFPLDLNTFLCQEH